MNDIRYQSLKRGFTMIEMMVVTMIIAILLALIVPALNVVRAIAAEQTCLNNLKQISQAIIRYGIQFPTYFPKNREGTDGNWYKGVYAWDPVEVVKQTPRGYSWQHILDKVLDADNNGGLLYTTGAYNISGNLINMRGASKIFTDRVHGYGQGVYIGTYGAFYRRRMPGGYLQAGPLSVDLMLANGAIPRNIPIIADGSRAGSDDAWVNRFKTPAKITKTPYDVPHVSVISKAAFEANETNLLNLDFRHRNRTFVLFLDWHIERWARPEQDDFAKEDLNSDLNNYKRIWDTMFPTFDPTAVP